MNPSVKKIIESKIYKSTELNFRDASCLYEETEVLSKKKEPVELTIKNTKYVIVDYFDTLPQSSSLPANISKEKSIWSFKWNSISSLENAEEPSEFVNLSEGADQEDLDWDDDIPKDFIDSFISGFDRYQLCCDLDEWYEGIENINLDDFPDALKPLINKCKII